MLKGVLEKVFAYLESLTKLLEKSSLCVQAKFTVLGFSVVESGVTESLCCVLSVDFYVVVAQIAAPRLAYTRTLTNAEVDLNRMG